MLSMVENFKVIFQLLEYEIIFKWKYALLKVITSIREIHMWYIVIYYYLAWN